MIIEELLKDRTVKIDIDFDKNETMRKLGSRAINESEKDFATLENLFDAVIISNGKLTNYKWVLFTAFNLGFMCAEENKKI